MKKIILGVIAGLAIIVGAVFWWLTSRADTQATNQLDDFLYEYNLDENINYAKSSYSILSNELTIEDVVISELPAFSEINVLGLMRVFSDEKNALASIFKKGLFDSRQEVDIRIKKIKLGFKDEKINKISVQKIDAPIGLYFGRNELSQLFYELGYGLPNATFNVQLDCQNRRQPCFVSVTASGEKMAAVRADLSLSRVTLSNISLKALESARFNSLSLSYQNEGLSERFEQLYQYANTISPEIEPTPLKTVLTTRVEEQDWLSDEFPFIPSAQINEMRTQLLRFIDSGEEIKLTVSTEKPIGVGRLFSNKKLLKKLKYQVQAD